MRLAIDQADELGDRDSAGEVLSGLRDFAREANLTAAQFTAIGAFSDLVLGFPICKAGLPVLPRPAGGM